MNRLTFIGGTLHGEPAPQTDENRIVSIDDGTVYIRRELRKLDAPEDQSPARSEFFVYEPLPHDEAAALAQPYW